MFGRKAKLPEGWESIVEATIPDWGAFTDGDRAAYIDALEWAVSDIAWEPVAGFSLDDAMRVTLAAPVALMALGLDDDQLRMARRFIVWPDTIEVQPEATPAADTVRLGALKFNVRNDPYTVSLPLALSWAEVEAAVASPEAGRNPVLRAVALCIDLADDHVDGVPPMDDAAREQWLAIVEPIFAALDAGEERAPLEADDASDAGVFLGAITEAFFLCAAELREYEPALYELLADFYDQDPASRASAGNSA